MWNLFRILAAGIAVAVTAGCGNQVSAPPPAVAVEDAPAQLEQVSATGADAGAQAMLNDAIAALRAKNYPSALFLLQNLSGRSDLTPEQQQQVSSALLAVNKALAEQAGAGDAQAQRAIQHYRATK